MKTRTKWILGLACVVSIGLIAFAVLARWQSPSEGEPGSRKPALSKKSQQILNSSDRFFLLSLDPVELPDPADTREKFHDWPILGRMEITDQKQKKELLTSLYRAVMRDQGVANCFNPRHGISASLGTNKIDLVICFECTTVEEHGTLGDGGTLIGGQPKELFNRTLQQGGVPLAKR